MGFNWVDFIIVATLMIFTIRAIGSSLIFEVLDFTSFFIAFILSFIFYNFPGELFESQFNIPHGASFLLGFITIWFLSETLFFFLVRLISPRFLRLKFYIPAEKFLVMIPAFLRGVILISLILVLLATFPIQPEIKKLVQESKLGSVILRDTVALEQPVKQIFGGVTNETLTFLTVKPTTNDRIELGFTTTVFQPDSATEQLMISLINQERTARGLKQLVFDEKLREVGRAHSSDMFTKGYFSHSSPEGKSVSDRASKAGIVYKVIGENLAFAPSLELAHAGLMNSPGHKANILETDYNKIGVGVMNGGVYGLMFTQVFSD